MQDAAQKPGPTLRAEPVTHEAFAPYGDRTSRLLAELF
jgi:ureidoglycolate hydrolase